MNNDDLTKVEGIGLGIEAILRKHNIDTYATLADTHPGKIKAMLESEGKQYSMPMPDSWPQQARLASEGKWDALAELQKELDGGR